MSSQSYPNQGGGVYSQPMSPLERHMPTISNQNNPLNPSELVSFTTLYNKEYLKNIGPRKANFFDVMSILGGNSLTKVFEIKAKKKEYSSPSPFPKKKQSYKISTKGCLQPYYFFSKEEITVVFDSVLEEMTKFQDPIIIPESQTFKLIATYYKIKPSVGSQMNQRSKSPSKFQRQASGKMSQSELNNKIVEIVF